jgi:hypothetical protein
MVDHLEEDMDRVGHVMLGGKLHHKGGGLAVFVIIWEVQLESNIVGSFTISIFGERSGK